MNRPFTFFIGSTSKIKVGALQDAVHDLNLHAAVSPIQGVESGVSEQPCGEDETFRGAQYRVHNCYDVDPRGDIYFAIENGIRQVEGEWLDFAYVLARVNLDNVDEINGKREFVSQSKSITLTQEKPGGFRDNTVGKTLKELELVRFHDDPHLDLCGESRRVILKRAIVELLESSGIADLCRRS